MPEYVEYWLHRAEQHAIAAVKAIDARVAAIHEEMSRTYSRRAVTMLSAIRPPRARPVLAAVRPGPAG